ncbi:uncharacterized protein Z519_10146 [Cladophialophora bantiana CBS 173.52]|uniref:Endoplasmic reticulum-based factor for assembly of V-ATPase n=1 Tax=Cladophialophora bantiana (strain ATCC 10958 / CBS 173.52 / CDC B-1940 / NIH 8579) TaxID=1442370 RepID=A0A0D2H7K7_CLAB1|nr:uncharacterized protein Z519_10146 [Cladophialophora bantiana CBS 173.52]KIW89293.1 hypothetical protein Z519_10146 [Cladophialophora bantiana CBS 173.52]
MVLLTTTPRILSAISSLSSDDRSSLASADLPTTCGQPIEHSTLIAMSRLTKTMTLNSLLRGTRIYVPPPPPKPQPSLEYVALMEKLRREQEQREYASLLPNSLSSSVGPGEEDEDDDISPSLVLNIFLSIILCAAAIFYLTRWWANDGLRVLCSLATGIVVGVAEVGVYAAYLRKVKMSRAKERKKHERKIVLREYTGKGPGGIALDAKGTPVFVDVNAIMEKEEIWGRGINGGMRRRVREKWQRDQEKVKT